MDRRKLMWGANIAGLVLGLGLILRGLLLLPGGLEQSVVMSFMAGVMFALYFGFNLRMMADQDDPNSPNKPR